MLRSILAHSTIQPEHHKWARNRMLARSNSNACCRGLSGDRASYDAWERSNWSRNHRRARSHTRAHNHKPAHSHNHRWGRNSSTNHHQIQVCLKIQLRHRCHQPSSAGRRLEMPQRFREVSWEGSLFSLPSVRHTNRTKLAGSLGPVLVFLAGS